MLTGREFEVEAVRELWSRALVGEGGCLGIVGEAGLGVSTLLHSARRHAAASGARLATVEGVAGESGLGGAALSQLCQELRPWPTSLAPTIVRRLEVVLRLGTEDEPTSTQRVTTSAALHTLIEAVAAERPLLVVVDGSSHVDRDSVDVLAFLARRLSGLPVAMLVGGRDLTGWDLAHVLRLGPLAPEDMSTILASLGSLPMSTRVARRVIAAACGNPSNLTSIAAALPAEVRSGLRPLPDPLPGAADDGHGPRSITDLPAPARRALATLAMADPEVPVPLATLITVAECSADDIADLERAGHVLLEHGVVRVTSPTVRSHAYWTWPAPDRRALHTRWADVSPDPATRAGHRASASTGPDPDLAAELEALAIDASSRGDHDTAAEFHTRARFLHLDPVERRRCSLAAAEAASAAGDPLAARVLLAEDQPVGERGETAAEEVLPLAIGARLAEMADDMPTAVDMWRRAIANALAECAETAAALTIDLCLALIRRGDTANMLDVVSAADGGVDPFADVSARRRCQLDIVRGVAEIASGRIDSDTITRVARYEELMSLGDDELVPLLPFVATAVAIPLAHFRQHEAAAAVADRCERIASARSIAIVGPAIATARCLSAMRSDLPGAAMYGSQAVTLAQSIGVPTFAHLAENFLLSAEAQLGLPDALAHIARVARHHDVGRRLAAGVALSGYWLTMGRADLALEAATSLDVPPTAAHVTSSRWLADLGEAAARCGQHDLARSAIERMRALDPVGADQWLTGSIERILGMLAAVEDCGHHFAASIAAFEVSLNTTGMARSELLWGERLRRARKRAEARRHLERARALFVQVGAGRWTERAELELMAAGAVHDAPDHTHDAERVLTPQELQVARLAVSGASYREIAGRLFISPRTVETHLSAVYRKLGVRNRAELSARASGDPALRSTP